MKVVLFCGGLGARLRDYSEQIPKPLVEIGSRPVLWHLMRYYAHFGHTDFILCLGYKGTAIKSYFRNYDEGVSNDFVLRDGGRRVRDDERKVALVALVRAFARAETLDVAKHAAGEEVPRSDDGTGNFFERFFHCAKLNLPSLSHNGNKFSH